jgi:hypothetical protein
MLRERIVWIVALLLIAGLGFYSGQTIGVRAGEQNRAQAAQGFFSQRGGQAGGFGGGQAGAGRGQGVSGTVSAVSGNTITITTRNGQTTNVQLAADGKVRKQVDGQLSDVTVGAQVVALGTQSGDTFQATSIQLGGFGGGFGGAQGGGRTQQATPTP